MDSPNYQSFKHSGINSDLPPEEVAASVWTGGSNVQFQDTATTRVGGYENYSGTPLGTGPVFALPLVGTAEVYWIYCSTQGVYVTDGINHFDITPVGLSLCEAGDWTGCILNGVPVLNNTIDEPFYWDLNTGNKCQTLPGWKAGATCKAIRAFKYHLFALNITDVTIQPDTLWWSAGAEPGAIPQEWLPAPDNDAGDMTLADTEGDILDGLALRDSFIVYKSYSTYALSYVAGQYVYTQQKLFLTTGIQSPNCIAEINGEHWVFTGSDVIKHDGQNYKSIVQDKIKHEIVDSIEPTKIKLPCITARHRNQQIWLGIPTAGNSHLNKAYVINILTGDVGIRELPNVDFLARGIVNPGSDPVTWDADNNSWDSDITFWNQQNYSPVADNILMCDQDSNRLWAADTTDTNDGAPVDAYVERLSLPTNDNINRAFITRVVPRITGEAGETIYITTGGQAYFDQPIDWYPAQPFIIGSDVGVSVQTEARLFSIRFSGTTNKAWKIHSYKIGIVDLGLY